MNKKLAWDTFKQTGSINSYLEFKEVFIVEKRNILLVKYRKNNKGNI